MTIEVEKIRKSAIHNDWKQIQEQKFKEIFFMKKRYKH